MARTPSNRSSAPQRKSSAEARRSTRQAATARMQTRGTRPESQRPTKQRLPEIAMGSQLTKKVA
jgi:hypothetical protein